MSTLSLEARIAETIADLSAVQLDNPEATAVMQAAFEGVLARFGGEQPAAVPLSEAAAELSISVPTLRTWIARGVLEEVSARRVRAVSAVSLGRVLALQRRLRDASANKRQLALILDELERRDMLADARAASAASDPASRISYDTADLAEIAEP